MICGSLALNSISNCFVHNVCVGNSNVDIDVPKFNYHEVLNFGSIEFNERQSEQLSQERGVSSEKVKQIKIDDSPLDNVRFIKIDVEGMEADVLLGAENTIEKSRPLCLVEILKSDKNFIADFFSSRDYQLWEWGSDFLCIPKSLAGYFNITLKEVHSP